MVPVIFLSDGYIANGAEPWKFPNAQDLKSIHAVFTHENNNAEGKFLPYKRDERVACAHG